ncbi:MAG: Cof-type HAD-IIB family hydrolase [Tissierellia bacterium]|nr:Cof-type HAD-IIB family hydrolase [Tissierellia bacterium]
MYKLIAIDLDGTLLDDHKEISKENIQLINKLIERDYEVVIATGRRYWSAKELTKTINKPLVILANNGSIVRETKKDRILFEKHLNIEDFRTVVGSGKERNLHPIIHVDNYENGYDLIVEMDIENQAYGNYFNKDEKRYKKVQSYLEIEDEKVLAVVYLGSKADMKDFYLDINKNYPNKYNVHIVENIRAAEALLEIMNPLVCKWQSLQEYARERGIKESEIIAIGDDNNDFPMIKNASLGIAMKNASKNVKSVADIITEKDNNKSGVAFELKKILKL